MCPRKIINPVFLRLRDQDVVRIMGGEKQKVLRICPHKILNPVFLWLRGQDGVRIMGGEQKEPRNEEVNYLFVQKIIKSVVLVREQPGIVTYHVGEKAESGTMMNITWKSTQNTNVKKDYF